MGRWTDLTWAWVALGLFAAVSITAIVLLAWQLTRPAKGYRPVPHHHDDDLPPAGKPDQNERIVP